MFSARIKKLLIIPLTIIPVILLPAGALPAHAEETIPPRTETLSENSPETVSETDVSVETDVPALSEADETAPPWAGDGSVSAPYELADAADLQALFDFVAAGGDTSQLCFSMTADITLPDGWAPIGDTSATRFRGTFDGCGHTVTVPVGGLPLFGFVKGAVIRNLNIYGERIAGYGLVNNYEGRGTGFSGSAVTIENVTLKSGSSTLRSGLVGANLTESIYAGAAAAFTVTIRNCVIEPGVVIGYDRAQSQIGSIAGRMQGTISNCVSYADVYGVDYVGGICGTRDNAMGACTISGCEFHGSVTASGMQAGGIMGGGYYHVSAPNGIRTSINDCSCDGTVIGADMVGGILGGDLYVAQAWNAYTIKNNAFTGSVTATAGTYLGGVIGFYDSLNRVDDIAGNYYSSACGADRGIGFVRYIDTSNSRHETVSGAIYFNTKSSIEDCPSVSGCHWKTGYNRTDDPMGADAENLCYTDAGTGVTSVSTEITIGQSRSIAALDAAAAGVSSWRSSRPEVVRVSAEGTAEALACGTARIRGMNTAGETVFLCEVQTRFTDVTDPDLFYYDPIYWAANGGITTGFADGTFRPLGNCTRAAVVTFLWRMAGRPTFMEYESTFTDLTGDPEFDSAILWAADLGITTGWRESDGTYTFRPWQTCNRAAIVTFLWRYGGRAQPVSGGAAPFTDMTENDDFNNAILWAAENDITTGWQEGDGTATFRPWNTCSRLAIVSFLARYGALSS